MGSMTSPRFSAYMKKPFVVAATAAVSLTCMLFLVNREPILRPADPFTEPVFFISRALAWPGFITSELIPWFVTLPRQVLDSDLYFASMITVVNTVLYWAILVTFNKARALWR